MCANHDLEEEVKTKYILHWSYRRYADLPQELLRHGAHVEEIYLRDNKILLLPKWLSELRSLTHLYLAGNHLEELPADVDLLANLSCLELSHNRLRSLPPAIVRLRSLNHLVLDFNCLQRLPTDIGQLNALYLLHVNDNSLHSLPESVCQCVSLTELCLHNNLLTSLPQPIVYLPNLETLSVHGNNLLYLPSVRFVCNCHLTFYNNPHLNYLSYHLTYGHDGDIHHLMSGCGGSLDEVVRLEQLEVRVALEKEGLQQRLMMPRALQRVFTRPDVTSLLELSLRAAYAILFHLDQRARLCNSTVLRELPHELQDLLRCGPTSHCAECHRYVFREAFLYVFLRCRISEHRKLMAVMFLCSHRCLCLYTARGLHESTAERVHWSLSL